MMNILHPEVADNKFKGNRIAYWVLPYVFKSFFAGFVHMFASDGGAQSIGDSFTQGGARCSDCGAWNSL